MFFLHIRKTYNVFVRVKKNKGMIPGRRDELIPAWVPRQDPSRYCIYRLCRSIEADLL